MYRAIAAGLRAFELIGHYPMGVVDIPLLYETGHAGEFDKVIATTCAPATQLARLVERGLTPEHARQRLAAQWPAAEKAARADFVIPTEGSFAETDRQVEDMYVQLSGGQAWLITQPRSDVTATLFRVDDRRGLLAQAHWRPRRPLARAGSGRRSESDPPPRRQVCAVSMPRAPSPA